MVGEPLEGSRYVIFLHLEEAVRKIYYLPQSKVVKRNTSICKNQENVKKE
jgi:hypothetical protein